MDHLFGYIERITFHNSENGFTVAKVRIPKKNDLVTIVGNIAALQPGEKVRCEGEWKTNQSHGMQFAVKNCFIDIPDDLLGIQKYLSSGLIRGIGPHLANEITKKFGLKTFEVIEKYPEELLSISGIGDKRVAMITECFNSQKHIREIMIFLQKYGLSSAYAHKVYRFYGNSAIENMENNPYDLAKNVNGIGFKMADDLAEKMGFSKDGAPRIDAGIEFALLELSTDGHCCFPEIDFLKIAQELLQVDAAKITERIHMLAEAGRIHKQDDFLWLKGLFLAEKGVARELARLQAHPCNLRPIDVEKAIAWVENVLRLQLAENQRIAVASALQDKMHIITGGPGTGKSTITKAILAVTLKLTRRIFLAAPTGRAAKRMSEITRQSASTIHSLLQYDFKEGGFRRNRDNPLPCDLLIIDEVSMIDTSLMYHLLKAIPSECKVLFVGDVHQLPSVGPGNVLKDMIESETLNVTILNKIFRQAAGSKIITNAHKINEGRFPDIENGENSDFFYIEKEEPGDVLETILSLVSSHIPKTYKLDPLDAIQVLAPMKKGVIGISNLNLALQAKLNPQKEYLSLAGSRFAPGDKVMQMRNNYDKEVFNGDIGRIKIINREEQETVIAFDGGKEVHYSFSEMEQLSLAYATSIHKYQGSECACIVMPIHTSHFIMLKRNLLYTGITRGKRLVFFVGNKKAIAIGVSNDDVKKRYTKLKEFLKIDNNL